MKENCKTDIIPAHATCLKSGIGIRNFILFTTVLSIFSGACRYRYFVDIKLFYLVVIVNTILLVYLNKIRLNKTHMKLLSILFLMGLISIVLKTNRLTKFLPQFLGISFISIYYYSFFRYQQISIENIFRIYCKAALWLSITGIIIFCYLLIFENKYGRLRSLMAEPSLFMTLTLPAFFYYTKNFVTNRHYKIEAFTIGMAIILASSLIGYIGLALALLLLQSRKKLFGICIAVLILISFFCIEYRFNDDIRMRVDDTKESLLSGEIGNVNMTTFSLLTNFQVSIESLKENFLIGGGLGSHSLTYDRYKKMFRISGNRQRNWIGWNSADAGVLFLRIMSELGLAGIIFVGYFIIKFRVKSPGTINIISNAILIYFVVRLLKGGHYFTPELYFFVMLYIFCYFKNLHREKLLKMVKTDNYIYCEEK